MSSLSRSRRSVPFFASVLALCALTGTVLAQATTAPAANLPAGKEVLEKYIEATGGRAAYEKVKSRVSHTTLEAPTMGIKGKVTIYQVAPDKGYIESVIEGVGKVEQGTDGTIAWERSSMMGGRILQGAEKDALMRTLNINSELHPETYYKSIQTVGTQDVGGKPAYKVELTTPAGTKETRFYDQQSGLLVRTESVQQSQMGEMKVAGTPGEYMTVDGIKMPKTVTQEMMGQKITLTIDKVEHNVDVPADKFAIPAEVKAQAEKRGSTTAPATQPR